MAAQRPAAATKLPVPALPRPAAPAARLILTPDPADANVAQSFGFLILCIYLLAAYANEFAVRALGIKPYITTVTLAMLPVALIASGNLFRCLRDTIGRLWLAFLVCMCLAVPFSLWRGGSVLLLRDYVARNWMMFLLIAGFAISLKHLRWLMGVTIAASMLLLVDCFVAARLTNGRLEIGESIFFSNANDLCLQLALAITQFLYLFFQPQLWQRVLALLGIAGAFLYSLQTGSRGGTLALMALMVVIFIFGKHKVVMVAVVCVAGMVAIVVVPAAAFHRISLLVNDDTPLTQSDLSATASRTQRLELLRQSLVFTVTHPVFGVGPGQFPVAVNGEDEKQGKRAPWLGTHNSYTEVSSECGIPAFLFYTSVVILCILSNLRTYQRSKNDPRLLQVSALAFSLMCGSVVFAVATFFYHIAYSGYLPALGGMTVALRLITDRSLWGPRRTIPAMVPRVGLAGQFSKGVA